MSIAEQIYYLFGLSLVVASISWSVTQEEIFAEPREYFDEKSRTASSFLVRKFFYIPTCEYCFSHWVTILILPITGFKLLFDDYRGYLVAFFAVTWVANQWMSLYRRLRIGIKHENILATKEKRQLSKQKDTSK